MERKIARTRGAWAGGALSLALALTPGLASSAPTPPPPAPQQQLGEVKVVDETPGSRTIVDSAGRPHVVMSKVTPAQRKAAAARARATREAATRKAQQAPASTPDSNGEVTK
jgi:hypothetical protein